MIPLDEHREPLVRAATLDSGGLLENNGTLEHRVLLLAPTGRDAELISRLLSRAGCEVFICTSYRQLCDQIALGASVVVLAEEGLKDKPAHWLIDTLNVQPAWSDLPVIVLTMGGKTTRHSARLSQALKETVNHAFLERPLRMLTLVSAVQAARRARSRQYEVRGLLGRAAEEVKKRDQFIAMLGHELRNPLAAIRTAIEVILRFGCVDPDLIMDQCLVIERQSKHMTRHVDDLLDVARLASGRVAIAKTPVDLRDCVQRSIQAIQFASPNSEDRFALHAPSEPVMIEGDVVRLEQVFGNLLSNSIRYSDADSVIEVTITSDRELAHVKVKDRGPGIDPEFLAKIFEPFVQSNQPLARSRGGLGLGLTVVRDLVKLHGGQVIADSDGTGQGSVFTVTLPLLKSDQPSVDTPAADKRPSVSRTILLVEDNADARHSLALLLRLLNHEVCEAEDGRAGLEKLVSMRPDVALIDIGLPLLSGYEVAMRARKTVGSDTYMVALTGYGQKEDCERALEAGFHAHCVKPIDILQINKILASVSTLGSER